MNKYVLYVLAGLWVGVSTAHATLGESEETVAKDQKVFSADHKTLNKNGYTVHQLKSSTYTVNEFIDSTGKVFAVTWRGAGKPDLSALFGSYFTEFNGADAKKPSVTGRRAGKRVESDHLVVQRSGHMRDLRGQAYVKELLPQGFKLGDLAP